MIVRVRFMIANPVRIRLVRYRLQRHQEPVLPPLQSHLRIPVYWSCITTIAAFVTSMCLIQMTVSRKSFRQCVPLPEELLLSRRENPSLGQKRPLAKCITLPNVSFGQIRHLAQCITWLNSFTNHEIQSTTLFYRQQYYKHQNYHSFKLSEQ